jgi:restriction system protein
MTMYRRIRLGQRGAFHQQCLTEGWAGLDFDLNYDLTNQFPPTWREFNEKYIPIWLKVHPGKSRNAAGLACALLWVFGHELQNGDILLAPDGQGDLHIGRINGPYEYHPGQILPHRRPVNWTGITIPIDKQTPELRASIRGALSLVDISQYETLINQFLSPISPTPMIPEEQAFALEQHLEDFLEKNWSKTPLGSKYQLLEESDQLSSRQYPTDTGYIDLLALSKDGQEYLVVELKRGKASDSAVGQILRYMGYIKEQIAEPHQTVRGAIIAFEDDLRVRRALQATTGITFYQYKIAFDLIETT